MPKGVYQRPDVIDRFWKQVNKQGVIHPVYGRCWEWMAGKDVSGYGKFKALGEWKAHRVAYRVLVGDIPKGLQVLHKCDNPECVCPQHLFLGTHQDNMDDRDKKGRQAKGERHSSKTHPEKIARGERHGSKTHPERLPRGDRNGSRLHPEKVIKGEGHHLAKLTENEIRLIRKRYKYGDRTNGTVSLSREFGVSPGTIGYIVRRVTWKHI